MPPSLFILTGGGTGGHVFPALAVAQVLKARGHQVLFVGTPEGIEARLVPQAGYSIEFIHVSGLNRVGLRQQVQSAAELPISVFKAWLLLRRLRPQAVFSMGGYAAGPITIAAAFSGVPLIVMEPNAVPGITNRKLGKRVYRALVGFESARCWFPPGRAEVTGLPVRPEFFQITPPHNQIFTLLITGGSQGARTLNRAARESWPLFRDARAPIRIIHQSGAAEHKALADEFATTPTTLQIGGEVVPFISDMAQAFAQADLIIGRAGAGSVNEIAAAGMPAVLVPFPFAADDHQRKNAEALVKAGAARMILDHEFTGKRLFDEVELLRNNTGLLDTMRKNIRAFAHPGAAERAAEVLEEAAKS